MSSEFSPAEFGAAWQKFIEYINANTSPPEPPLPPLVNRLTEFLNAEPTSMIILKETFLERDLPNLQIALDRFLTGSERTAELIGYIAPYENPDFGLAYLLTRQNQWQATTEGPVRYRSVPMADGSHLQCVEKGLYLISDHGAKALVFIRAGERYFGSESLLLEILCLETERAEAILSELRALVHQHNIYRGQVISLVGRDDLRFHSLPNIDRNAIVLPAHLLEALELNTLGFAEHASRLQAAGRHLKRGLLLHGSPGTGKTMSMMYLISRMKGRTAILLTGRGMGLITQSCQLARWLAPAVVVLEDVDLVAKEREGGEDTGPLLFELLNEMDGLSSDTDVLFLLSTNRPDLLEPALAARPGRIDQAFEFPLPDLEGRRRLLTLYGQGLDLSAEAIDDMAGRTEGASPAFIRELLRKAALIAADQSRDSTEPPAVSDAHLREALRTIFTEGGQLTKRLLGVAEGAMEDEK